MVIDLLATLENGFSMTSQVDCSENEEHNVSVGADAEISGTSISKIIKAKLSAKASYSNGETRAQSVKKEVIHTNASSLAKLRGLLIDENLLNDSSNMSDMRAGEFVEIEGKLQKNPLIDYMERVGELLKVEEVKGGLSHRVVRQIEVLMKKINEVRVVDFLMNERMGTTIFSAKEQYLVDKNMPGILEGQFKVLGKVISVCCEEKENIDLLRKTAVSIFTEKEVENIFLEIEEAVMQEFGLSMPLTKIKAPAIVILPVAIYI